MSNDLDYEGINFPVSKKDYCKIEQNSISYRLMQKFGSPLANMNYMDF